MQRSLSDVIGLKQKILELLNEPTLDKACSTVATTLLTAVVIIGFTVQDLESMFWFTVYAIGIGVFGWVYKKFNLPLQILEDERKKENIKFDHLIKNPKLEATEIQLDVLAEVHDEMAHLRTHFQQLTSALANKIVRVEDDNTTDEVHEVNKSVNGGNDTIPAKPVEEPVEEKEPSTPDIPPSDPAPSPDEAIE